MKRVTLVAVFLLFVAAIATAAEDAPKVELFGGYSFLHCNPGIDANCNLNGWTASAAFKVNNSFGFVADFGGDYGTVKYNDMSVHSFLFGPKVAVRKGKVTPFAQALFGVSQTRSDAYAAAYSDFAMALGGGLDINAGEKVAIRIAQVEYIATQENAVLYNHFRYSAGVVLKLGK